MTDLEHQLAGLSPERRKLLEILLQQQAASAASDKDTAPRPNASSFPVSFAQQRLWFLDQFEPDSPLYNIILALRVQGNFDTTALANSINVIIARHAVLRTTFAVVDGEPVQVVAPHLTIPLPLVNLCHIPAELFDDEAQRQGRQVAAQPFDLAAGPLLRATLLRFADQDHVLVLVMHHSISDGWSDNILLRELTLLYQAARLNQADPLPPLPIQYADYARWQRAWLKGEMRDQQVSYWQQQLHGPLPLLDLPTDHFRPPIQAFHGARQSVTFPATLTKPLKIISHGEGATLFMTLLAAFQTLLHRYTGQTDLLVGSPIAGRTRTETEALIGCFVNTLVLRTDLTGNPRFRALIRQVRDTAFQAYAHQDLPFEMVVEAVQPARDLSRSPLFQVMFVFQNTPQDVITLPGLRLQPLSIDSSMAKFDLTLTMIERPEGLVARLEYNTELFEAATIDRLLTHFHTLLDGIVADPDCHLADLPLVSPVEYEQLVVAVNATYAAFPEQACLQDLIHAQAQQTPAAIAVVADDGQLSYQQLTTRASQLAHYLQQMGVGPDVCVGIALDRSLDLVVAVLAVLTAGGAYVPLDPSYPRERLHYMQASAEIAVLLTQTQLVASLPPTTAQVVCLDRDWPLIAQQPVMRPSSTVHPDNLAYVIYTSGSTGQPKGVQLQHRSVVNFLHAMQQQLGMTSQERVLALTTLAFDPSVLELLLPLTVGAQTLVVSRIVAVDGARLRAVIEQHKLTLLQATPATWRLLLAAGWQSQAGLTLLCGGEALSVDLAQQLRAGGGTLWNVYGPTETTVWSTTAAIGQSDGRLPIGRPIANMEMYVLDTQLQVVPTGVRGELYIGGVGVARGYRNRPDLTAERFMPHPFSSVPGARLYRTGDLVRRLTDGQLEYLGRLDHQVKVRGFRIELGEIEAVLARHPTVHACVVMAREDRPGDQQLVGYVVVQTDQELPTVHALRTWLQTSLPEYMVPAAFVFLEHLPLTPNGKVDRRALPAPAETAPREAFVAPRTSFEQQLATIWAEVLNRTLVGMTDNFFALGGHSLLATRLITRLRDQLQIELPLRSLFEHPTIAELAAYLEIAQAELDTSAPHTPNEQTALLLQPRSADGIAPLSFAQQRLWFLDQLDPNTAAYTIPATLRLEGQLDEAALEHSFSALVTRHAVLRTTFPLVDEQPVQHIAPPAPCPIACIDLQHLPQTERYAEALQLGQVELQRPFDLARGPLLRVTLLRLAPDDHLLVLALHHSISDGWSTGVLVRELVTLYRAFHSWQVPTLPPLPIQYADYARWQRDWLQGTVRDQQLAYWRQQLQGPLAVLDLPTDHPRPSIQTFRGAQVTMTLSPELLAALQSLSQREGATLFMTLLAALQTLLYRYTGQTDLLVGSPIAGRTRTETEALIGCFVNTLVLRTDLTGNPRFRELIGRVRDTALQAYAHQDLPFEMVVEAVQSARDLSRSPLFQVMFVLQNTPQEPVLLPGLRLQPLVLDAAVAKFDLTLTMIERPEGLVAWLEYNTDLFEAATMERLLMHFHTLLEGIVVDPDCQLADLPLVSPAEYEQLVVAVNATHAAFPEHACLHDLIHAQAQQTPTAIAVLTADGHLSYQQLTTRASQLAHYLQQLGVGPDVCVGIALDRSLDLVVAVLAVLTAGGAYVPLDPSYPSERLRYMQESAQIAVLLTQTQLVASLPPTTAPVVCLDHDWPLIVQQPGTLPSSTVHPDNLAYVIYTSGSTGQPKGVQLQHRSVVNFLHAMQQQLGVTSQERLLALTTLSFDISVLELLLPLTVGAQTLVVSRIVAVDGARLRVVIEQHKLTLLQATPATWRLLLAAGWQSQAGLTLLCGGEALSVDLAQQLRAGGGTLWNVYGPTETTVWSTTAAIGQSDGRLPIGRPIANMEMYVLDTQLQIVPIGVLGELYIGGVGVARGYRNRPDLTAERFMPHPFSSVPGARLYRTGDLVRRLPDGQLEYLGRLDHQVKLRGFRIELGEIEAVLARHPAVHACVVMAREDRPGDQRLVAYIVVQTGQEPPAMEQLRAWLQPTLPEYMLPAAFVFLEHLPLTPNGKVDRRALPAPAEITRSTAFVGPRTAVEEVLAGIWSNVLDVAQVGMHDDFFDLGGHSLKAVLLNSRVREIFRVTLPLRSLFEATTVATLAHLICAHEARPGQSEKIAQLFKRIQGTSADERQLLLEQKRSVHQNP